MAFKRGGRPTYYIGPLTVAGIDVPRISTGVANGRAAKSMETALLELATSGYSDLVRQVAAGNLTLAEVYEAKLTGEEALNRLQTRGGDPLLSDIIGEMGRSGLHAVLSDERTLAGLELLRTLTRRDARLSSLCDPKQITSLYERAIQGTDRNAPRRPNTVRRSLHRAVSEILTHEFGRGKMLAIMADVRMPWENDERIVFLSREEITRALEITDPEFRPVIGLAVTTGIDRGACRTTRVRHYDPGTGVLTIVDTKNVSRPRTLMPRGEPVLKRGALAPFAGRGPCGP